MGTISAANSLVGSTAFDQVGDSGVAALTNGNYVVRSPRWDGAGADTGAATWGDGASGVAGPVSAANSLVGSTAGDMVSSDGVTALTNGNYVVRSSNWDGPAGNALGAATWGNGLTGISGTITPGNSLVGSTPNDAVSTTGVIALSNGNYVVLSPVWDGAAVNVGAATWGNGGTGTSGTISAANSLVGSTAGDQVGADGATALTNGNYVVRSSFWNGAVGTAGAATWGSGAGGVSGLVSQANSLVGTQAGDRISSSGVAPLSNGNYVVPLFPLGRPGGERRSSDLGQRSHGDYRDGFFQQQPHRLLPR